MSFDRAGLDLGALRRGPRLQAVAHGAAVLVATGFQELRHVVESEPQPLRRLITRSTVTASGA